jgi:hypothetical protein
MISVESDAVIERPVDEVFDFVSDQTNEPKWHTDILDIRPASGSSPGLGSTWIVTVKFMGRNEHEVEVTRLERNRLVEITTRTGPMKATATYLFEPVDGHTRFIRRVVLPVEGSFRLMKPLMQIMARKRNAGFVQNLKELLER